MTDQSVIDLLDLVEEYAKANPDQIADIEARYAEMLPDLDALDRSATLSRLVDLVDKIDTAEMEYEHHSDVQVRISARDNLPFLRDELNDVACKALVRNGSNELRRLRGVA